MSNEYGLDTDYFIRLCEREFNPDVIRRQRPRRWRKTVGECNCLRCTP